MVFFPLRFFLFLQKKDIRHAHVARFVFFLFFIAQQRDGFDFDFMSLVSGRGFLMRYSAFLKDALINRLFVTPAKNTYKDVGGRAMQEAVAEAGVQGD